MRGTLQLGLSKWDLENPGEIPGEFSAVEIPLREYFGLSPRKRLGLRRRMRKGALRLFGRTTIHRVWGRASPTEELPEKMLAAREEWGDALGGWIVAGASRSFDRLEGHPDLAALTRNREALGDAPLHFEWGQEDDFRTTAFLAEAFPQTGWVVDPDVHRSAFTARGASRSSVASLHFKLHGWHPERWVRRYGPRVDLLLQRIRLLRRREGASSGAVLFLSHSGRIEEAERFQRSIDGEV